MMLQYGTNQIQGTLPKREDDAREFISNVQSRCKV